ncbi:MAG TPA: helix-turn-helix domain-containing protein [Burkholderiaceae bacterium]|nr:helix-turn-helix domain-containing protein [Burkholderiaceae bacterium]
MDGADAESAAERWVDLLNRHLRQLTGADHDLVIACKFRTQAPYYRAQVRSGLMGPLHYCHLETDARDTSISGLAPPGSDRQTVLLQLSGTSRVTAEAKEVRLLPGDMLLIHSVGTVRIEDDGRVEQIAMTLEVTEAFRGLPEGLRRFQPSCIFTKMAFRLVRESCSAAAEIPPDIAACIARLISALLAQASTARPVPQEGRSASVSAQAIQEYIEHSLADPNLSLRRISQAFGCNVRTLHRAFNRPGALSLSQYLWRRRIEASAEVLRASGTASQTLTQIAHDLGFSSSGHFSTMFRKVFGVSPSEYRRHHVAHASIVGIDGEPPVAEPGQQ